MTQDESVAAIAVIKGKPLRELLEGAKRIKSVKSKPYKKGSPAVYVYKGKNITELNQGQLADIHIEALTERFNVEKEQSGHALQEALGLAEIELENVRTTLAEKEKAHAVEMKEITDRIQELELNAVEGPKATPFADVKEFTEIAGDLSSKPKKITKEAVEQIKLFIMEEFTELEAERSIPSAVADWIVDHIYYMLNFASKNGYNLDKVWSLVHEANMRKFPDGVCTKSENGKIMKPSGWQSNDSDVAKEVNKQITNGSW